MFIVFQVGKQKQEKGQKWLQYIGYQFAFCGSFSGKSKSMEPRYVRTLVLRVKGVRKYYVSIYTYFTSENMIADWPFQLCVWF